MEILDTSKNLTYSSTWNGYPVLSQYAPLNTDYLSRILGVIETATAAYPNVMAIRFDLRLPHGYPESDSAVISRFMESLNSQLYEDRERHSKQGGWVPSCKLRDVWAKERGGLNEGLHYHVCIFLNQKRYAGLGNYIPSELLEFSKPQGNMAFRIRKAWLSATGGAGKVSDVHFCDEGVYVLNKHSPEFERQKSKLFERLSYLAKTYTKETVQGRKFGYSRT